MNLPFRALFLLVAAAAIFHLSGWIVFVLIAGYVVCAELDNWQARRAKKKETENAVDDELYGWEADPEDPESETKGALSRTRLVGKDQIVVSRVAQLLLRISTAGLTK